MANWSFLIIQLSLLLKGMVLDVIFGKMRVLSLMLLLKKLIKVKKKLNGMNF